MQVISAKHTNILRFVIIPLVIVLLGACVALLIWKHDTSLSVKGIVAISWGWGSYYLWSIARVLAKVKLGDKMLLVTRGKASAFVPLQTIRSVQQLPYVGALGPIISIDLNEPTALGTNIKFSPQTKLTTKLGLYYLRRVHPLVGELHGRVLQARYH